MKTNAFTWIGFIIVALGWLVLAAALALSETWLKGGSLVSVLSFRSDLITLAQTAIVSGFGLAIFGVLRSGFGAFSRFFEAVLQRSGAPRPAPLAAVTPAPIVTSRTEIDEPVRAAAPERPRAAPVMPASPFRERNYVILPDGSVEVETMFGTRVFATLDEARDFIR